MQQLNKKLYLQREAEAAEIQADETDREHMDLYNKIDRYLTKINTFKIYNKSTFQFLLSI